MRVLLLDNHDSFTWNLHHVLQPLVEEVDVVRNDAITVAEAATYDRLVLSPGPGLPSESGVLMDVVRELLPTHPMLGVCLGMQALVEVCGGSLFQQTEVMHGRVADCRVEEPGDPLFQGLPARFPVGLYHSWAAALDTLPAELQVTARSERGVIMAVRHRHLPACGVQFHPESVMTPDGARLLANWVRS